MNRKRHEVNNVRISDEEYGRLENKYDLLRNEVNPSGASSIIKLKLMALFYSATVLSCVGCSQRLGWLIEVKMVTNNWSRWRTGTVASVVDYGPSGPWFETWPGCRSLWP